MLFNNIAALVASGVKIAIQIESAENGQLEVLVVPTASSGKAGLSLVAKSFVGTPQELDESFAEVIAGFCTVNGSLKDQLAALQVEADRVLKDAQEAQKAASKAKATPSKSSTSPSKPASPTLRDPEEEGEGGDDEAGSTGEATTAAAEPEPFSL
jgi:PRTRC genetic system protein E